MAKTRSKDASTPVKTPTKTPTKAQKKSASSTPSKKAKDSTPSKVVKPKGKVIKAAEIESVEFDTKKQTKKDVESIKEDLVSLEKIEKALESLKTFVEKSAESESSDLLHDEDLASQLELVLSKKQLFTAKHDLKQRLIKVSEKTTFEEIPKVALLVRDNLIDSKTLEEIESSELNQYLTEIIPVKELASTYKAFEKKRELSAKFDLFLADDAIIPTLPNLLGKSFYERSKAPIAIKVLKPFSIAGVLGQTKKVLNSKVYRLSKSNQLTIQLGKVDSVTATEILKVINHFSELRDVFIKSNQSPALPLYESSVVYTEDDKTSADVTESKEDNFKIAGYELPKGIKFSPFEKSLIEVGNDAEIKALVTEKLKKFNKKVGSSASKTEKKPAAATAKITNGEKAKVTKPKSKKTAKK
ncbi:hypothetical protein WICPIJ_007245 [Wickerhamomyces pijperi]|uniref:Ribosomal protein L1 n=1 Tax=Wickerhamomyces pijperi TaxID=599730 RepID=A0A9P8Q0J9_WICPI|nr:hypothetical protein WICPIJ_007245 [Wickerhamomyces pijperi]